MPSWIQKLARCLALIALLTLCNGQFAVLQTIAWTKMLIDYSQQTSLTMAVSETFDGQHPCALCKKIAHEKDSQQKSSAVQSNVVKMPLFCEQSSSPLAKLEACETAPILDYTATSRNFPPLLQPPRA